MKTLQQIYSNSHEKQVVRVKDVQVGEPFKFDPLCGASPADDEHWRMRVAPVGTLAKQYSKDSVYYVVLGGRNVGALFCCDFNYPVTL